MDARRRLRLRMFPTLRAPLLRRAPRLLACCLIAPVALGLSADMDSPREPAAAPEHEFQLVRLAYSDARSFGFRRRSWLIDAPEAEVHFLDGVQRLARIDTSSYSVALAPLDDRLFDYPFLYAVEVGHWSLSDPEAQRLREYLLRGGFLMTDDFHGTFEWDIFTTSMSRVFPDRPIVDIDNKDAIFHVLYDLDDRFQVPGIIMFYTGRTYEYDGVEGKWRGIYDDKGRLMVAVCHNMDLGDAWEWADHPQYPEKYASLAYRVGINYIIYAMTH